MLNCNLILVIIIFLTAVSSFRFRGSSDCTLRKKPLSMLPKYGDFKLSRQQKPGVKSLTRRVGDDIPKPDYHKSGYPNDPDRNNLFARISVLSDEGLVDVCL